MKNLDPRTKILIITCTGIVAMLTKRIIFLSVLLTAVLILMFLMGISVVRLRKQLAGALGMITFIFVLQAVFGQWELGLILCLRLLILLLSALILLTGEPRDYLLAMVQCHLPYELAYMVILAFHFFPLLREEAFDIYYSMQLRGTELKNTSIKNKLKAYIGMCTPIIYGAIKRAENTATLMEARGFRSAKNRTYLNRLMLKKEDIALMLIIPVLSAGFVYAAHTINISQGTFLVAGDIQYSIRDRDYEIWGDFMKDAAEDNEDADFIIFTGDMVNNVSDEKDWDSFFDNESKSLGNIKIYATPGNHETSVTPDEYLKYLKSNDEFYSFDYENCHFVSLNSCIFMSERKNTKGYKEEIAKVNKWLKDDLAKSNKSFKIIFMHHPPYPVDDDSYIYEEIRKNWEDIFTESGVQLCFCGHQHVYMRSDIINGITYVMSRSGEKSSKYIDDKDEIPAYVKELYKDPVYISVSVMKKRIIIKAVNKNGRTVDRFSIKEIH